MRTSQYMTGGQVTKRIISSTGICTYQWQVMYIQQSQRAAEFV